MHHRTLNEEFSVAETTSLLFLTRGVGDAKNHKKKERTRPEPYSHAAQIKHIQLTP